MPHIPSRGNHDVTMQTVSPGSPHRINPPPPVALTAQTIESINNGIERATAAIGEFIKPMSELDAAAEALAAEDAGPPNSAPAQGPPLAPLAMAASALEKAKAALVADTAAAENVAAGGNGGQTVEDDGSSVVETSPDRSRELNEEEQDELLRHDPNDEQYMDVGGGENEVDEPQGGGNADSYISEGMSHFKKLTKE